jgi:hypothetical protein
LVVASLVARGTLRISQTLARLEVLLVIPNWVGCNLGLALTNHGISSRWLL